MTPLPLSTLLKRTLLAIVVPQRVFLRIDEREVPSWFHMFALLCVVAFVGTLIGPYFAFGHVLFRSTITDWFPLAIGWIVFTVNQWLLCMLAFLAFAYVRKHPVATIAPFGVASFYLMMGLWVILFLVDPLHRLFGIPTVPLHLPFLERYLHIMNAPHAPVLLYLRLSYLVMFPWVSLSLWMALRRLFRLSGWSLFWTSIIAVVLPLMGRVMIEPLPWIVAAWLMAATHKAPSLGWTVLCINIGLCGIFGLLLRIGVRVLRRPSTTSVS